MKLRLLGFILRRVAEHLRQLIWAHVLTAGIIAVALFVVGAFMLVEINLEHLLRGWGSRVQIIAYLTEDTEKGLVERVQAMPEVEQARYVSRDQAWNDFRSSLGAQSDLLEGLPREVLPASVELSLKSGFLDSASVEAVARRLRAESAVSSVEYPSIWVDRLSLFILWVQWIKWLFGAALFLAAFFVVGSTIKLAALARKDEVEIMQLVGASEELIQAPFVIEGMLQGATGAVLALAGLVAFFVFAERELATAGVFLMPLATPQFLDSQRMLTLLGGGVLVGAVGSLAALRRFLKTWRIVQA